MRRKRPAPVTDTLIGRGTIAEGRIECDAGLRIEGEFTGEIVCRGDVVIGESGIVRSSVTARGVTVAGKLYGSVTAHGRFTLLKTGEMHGDVAAAGYVIEGGAKLNADCRTDPSLTEARAEGPRESGLKQPAAAVPAQPASSARPHASAPAADPIVGASASGALPAAAVARDVRLSAPQAKKQAG
jgi:cytoskeletal protein CcmA (bactofilin family)